MYLFYKKNYCERLTSCILELSLKDISPWQDNKLGWVGNLSVQLKL
jgi:hypothetical protein